MALSRHHAALDRPRSVQELVEEARSFEFNTTRTLQQWIRSGKMLLTEAAICEDEENIQMAYLYMYRHAELVIAKLPEHPEYKDVKYKADLTEAKKAVKRNLLKLERWNPRINQDYQRYAKTMERRHAERQRIQEQYDDAQQQRRSHECHSQYMTQNLNTRENREAAIGRALQELQRRGVSNQVPTRSNGSIKTVPGRPLAPPSESHDNQLSDDIRRAAHHLQPTRPPVVEPRAPLSEYTRPSFAYPAVPTKEGVMEWRTPNIPPPAYRENDLAPAIPSKTPIYDTLVSELPATAPPLPSKESISHPPAPTANTASEVSPVTPTPDTPITSLRPLLLPSTLTSTFTKLASHNTHRNLETCGILAGTLLSASSTLALTHLILPEQTATPNTCDTTAAGDAALFDYCDAHRLLVLGWIHTHPSQTCFLSSRDLHTSAGYQTMLPEAIAIVCAPRHDPGVGIFRLTDPPGLQTIVACTHEGTFHPHPDVEGGLYTDADAGDARMRKEPWGGHVVVAEGLKLEVVDLRGKS